ncbi:MAG: alkaline phosphatase [Tissierellales bacterium]|nr:alkaline phosphatase [Tissierellales bacterium]
MKSKRFLTMLLTLIILLTSSFTSLAVGIDEVSVYDEVKNVIILIPDGMSSDAVTLARWYNGGKPLNLDELAVGMVRTYSSDAPIADSAPAATAMATGYKSHTGYIGVLPDVNTMPGLSPIENGNEKMPIANLLEAARLSGRATGIISTSEIMHATPASFSAHDPSRKNYDSISEQQVYQGIDVVLGGGTSFFRKELRKDKEDLISEIKKEYNFVTTLTELNNVKEGKVWGMFGEEALSYDFDRDQKNEPSLAEMTAKAIEILSKNEKGFFLMVEGSKIDWAAHANDPIGLISDILAFDKAVGEALKFAKSDGNTLVIAASDHGNSGITIGNANTSSNYDKLPLSAFLDPLKKAELTGEGIEKHLNDDKSNVRDVMRKYYGINDLTNEEVEQIKNTKSGSMNYTVGPMIAKRANIGFTTNGHTGEDVTLYVYAPKNIDLLTGVIENTDIAKYAEKAMGLDLNETSKKLFVWSRGEFEALGAEVQFDNLTDPKNPVLIVTKGDIKLEMPINKNIAYVNGEIVKLDGVVVYNGIKTYVPQSALELVK